MNKPNHPWRDNAPVITKKRMSTREMCSLVGHPNGRDFDSITVFSLPSADNNQKRNTIKGIKVG